MFGSKLWLAQRGLNSDSAQKRLEAVRRMRALQDPAAIEALTAALQDAEPAVRAEVVNALGDFNQREVIKPLTSALRDQSDAVQELAIQALKKHADQSLIDPLVGTLLRGSPGVQYHAAQLLTELGWSPRTMGEQIPYYLACGDFKRVTMFGSAAVSALAGVLRSGPVERRVAAASALAEVGEAGVIRPLIGALKDPDVSVRATAARSLARTADQQAIPGLLAALKDRDRNVRVAVVSALGQLGNKTVVGQMLAIANDREWEVRAALAEALGRLGDRAALPVVLRLVQDRDQEVRQTAVEALGRVGDESALAGLMSGLLDEHMGVRQAAARALMMLDPYWERSSQAQAFVPKLQEALQHRNPAVQFAAVSLLRRLTGKSALDLKGAALTPRAGAAADRSFDRLVALIRDPDDEVRLAVVEAITRLNLPAGVPVLQTALSDKNRWVKQAADQGLLAMTKKN